MRHPWLRMERERGRDRESERERGRNRLGPVHNPLPLNLENPTTPSHYGIPYFYRENVRKR